MIIDSVVLESQPSQPHHIFGGLLSPVFSIWLRDFQSAGPFSGLVKMGLLKEQEIPYLADRAQRLDMKIHEIHEIDPQTPQILSVPFRMDLKLGLIEEHSKIRL